MSLSPSLPPSSPPIRKFHNFYERHEHTVLLLLFVCGFLFDMVMLERIDSWMTIGQQGLYLILIMVVLLQLFFEQSAGAPDVESMMIFKRWYYEYRVGAMHFFFGTLLNGYTLFFFKSSSLIVSFAFLLFMVGLLLINESRRFKSSGVSFKFGLLALCLLCYFAYLIPIIAGAISTMVFLLSMTIGTLPLVFVCWWIQNYRPILFDRAKRQILTPMALVLLGFLSLYILKLIPPVPLSIPYMGIFHSVEKTSEGYRLASERPWWRVWQNGDQEFHAGPGDKVYVFFRIFSPTRFSDQVSLQWYWKDNRQGWLWQGAIPIKIVGGREQGFRGFGVKANYQPGDWRVQVETNDGREIGRIYFTLDLAPDRSHLFSYQLM